MNTEELLSHGYMKYKTNNKYHTFFDKHVGNLQIVFEYHQMSKQYGGGSVDVWEASIQNDNLKIKGSIRIVWWDYGTSGATVEEVEKYLLGMTKCWEGR